MTTAGPSRTGTDLADVVELLLDKGIVVNADIAVSVGDTELLGIRIRAAIASFETAATYGLEFPGGTDTEKLEAAAERQRLSKRERPAAAVARSPSDAGPGARPGEETLADDGPEEDTDRSGGEGDEGADHEGGADAED